MSSSCKGLLVSYVKCLRETDCMQVEGKSVGECANGEPEACESLRVALYRCRRGQVDMRTRIQGNKGY